MWKEVTDTCLRERTLLLFVLMTKVFKSFTNKCSGQSSELLKQIEPQYWRLPQDNKNGLSMCSLGLPRWVNGKESTCNAGDSSLTPGLGGSLGEGNGNPLLYSCLGNTMDRAAWWATVHGAAKSQTWLTSFHFPTSVDWLNLAPGHGLGLGPLCFTILSCITQVGEKLFIIYIEK